MESRSPNILETRGSEIGLSVECARQSRKPLKSFRWRDLQAIFAASFSDWSKHKARRLGASLAFYTLLSIAPFLLVLVSVVGIVLGRRAAEGDIIAKVQAAVGSQGAAAARSLLEASRNTAQGVIATAFGILTLLFGASGVLAELRDALNTIWEVPTPTRSGVQKFSCLIKARLLSCAGVLAIGFILAISLAANTWLAALGAWSASVLPAHELILILNTLNLVISFLIITGLFSAVYKFLPDVRIDWRDVVLGGAVTSALFGVGKLALAIYLGRASFASTYGAAASIVVVIIWVYYSAQIFFFGAEFTKTFASSYGSQPSPR